MTPHLFDLNGKTTLVTGAAQGLGLAMTTGLAQAGAQVVLNDIQEVGIAIYLASSASNFVTGQVIYLDGGTLAAL
jgi:NAD(P)-dependent dehydrogenase (short-subunit alcohol dehydrogenase family)